MKKNWWQRPAGGKEIVITATPMIISSGSLALMELTDRVFLTWYEPASMGAAFTAGHLAFLAAAFPLCIAEYSNAFVSQYNGAREYGRIPSIVWQGVFLAIFLLPFYLLAIPFSHIPFECFGHTAEQVARETTYFDWLLPGLPAMIANGAFSSFFSGRKKMKTVMFVNTFSVLSNVVLDYLLIFGIGGYCQFGLAGAALATALSQWLRLTIYLILIAMENRRTPLFHFFKNCRFNCSEFLSLLKFGGISGFQLFVDILTFTGFIMLVGKVGETATIVTAIAFNLNTLIFLPILGLGVAVVTLVGNRLGENRPDLARRAALTSLAMGIFITGFFVFAFLLAPDPFLSLYAQQDPEGFKPIRDLTVVVLRYISLYLFFDTIGIVFASTLKGAGDILFPALTTAFMAPVLILPVGIGIFCFNFGIHWCWSILASYMLLLSLIYCIRFFRGKWMSKRLFQVKDSVSNIPILNTTSEFEQNQTDR